MTRLDLHQLPKVEIYRGLGWLSASRALVPFVNKNDPNGYYRSLGLSSDASIREIKERYRELVKELHPDRNPDPDALEQYYELMEISRVLLDPELKCVYDSTESGHIYIGNLERERAARIGLTKKLEVKEKTVKAIQYWDCFKERDFDPSVISEWIELCREVSLAVGYQGRIRVGVFSTGLPWAVVSGLVLGNAFIVFDKDVVPNRLLALCGMIEWQESLLEEALKCRP